MNGDIFHSAPIRNGLVETVRQFANYLVKIPPDPDALGTKYHVIQ